MAAPLALIGAAVADAGEARVALAAGTRGPQANADIHKLIEASGAVRIVSVEVENRVGLGHVCGLSNPMLEYSIHGARG